MTQVPDLPDMQVRGRNGIAPDRWDEFWGDRQNGMQIGDLVSKYGVSRGYVFTLLRRLRAEQSTGK